MMFGVLLLVSMQSHLLMSSVGYFIEAIRQDDIEAVQEAIAAGANINFVDSFGTTPLMRAVCIGNLDMVLLLLQAGADVNVMDSDNFTPLNIVFHLRCNPLIALELLRYGAEYPEELQGQVERSFLPGEENQAMREMLLDAYRERSALDYVLK